MKHVNLEPQLEKKKDEIMEQFTNVHSVKVAQPMAAAGSTEPPSSEPDSPADDLKERVIEALKTIYDPEIPVNIYDLGLIYAVNITAKRVDVDMTLTAPGCPVAHTFPGMVESSVKLVPGVEEAHVELVWDPPWSQENISEAARLQLGLI